MAQCKKITTQLLIIAILGFSIHAFSKSNKNKMEYKTKEKIGLLVTMKAKSGKEQEVKEFLKNGLHLVNQEPGTESWYAFQIDESTFGIFDTFSNEEDRQAHLTGEVAKALLANAGEILEDFEVNESIQPVDVIASKLSKGNENKGLLVIMKAKELKSSDVENFLLTGKELVEDEPKTLSWYAIRLNNDTYAIIDTFTDNTGRDAHLNGKGAVALLQNAPSILKEFKAEAIQKIDILASK